MIQLEDLSARDFSSFNPDGPQQDPNIQQHQSESETDNELPGMPFFALLRNSFATMKWVHYFSNDIFHRGYIRIFFLVKEFSSVDEVVEYCGFGWFQIRLILLTGLAIVCYNFFYSSIIVLLSYIVWCLFTKQVLICVE